MRAYLAVDTELDRTVAIKIHPENLASDQQRLQRFIQEAKAASALNHPRLWAGLSKAWQKRGGRASWILL